MPWVFHWGLKLILLVLALSLARKFLIHFNPKTLLKDSTSPAVLIKKTVGLDKRKPIKY
jgi:hypothetical protein